ncbi:MAG: hypothetical protein ACP5JG_15495 [Anaerolineae bacterium]
MSMLPEDLLDERGGLADWIATYHYAHFEEKARSLPLRRDTITVLTYVRDHKVVGTKSTGNMPLKHIRAVTAEFVEPPVLDEQIGDRTYKLRTEFDVWRLFFIHVLLEVAELLETPQGGRWQLTEAGERFLDGDPLLQTLFLFSTWWDQVDWRIAINHELDWLGLFPTATLALLLSQPVGTWIDFETFAMTLNQRTRLSRILLSPPDSHNDNLDFTRMLLLSNIRHMVVDRLFDFGVAEGRYRYKEKVADTTLTIQRLDALKITWFGRALLDGLGL